MRGLWAFVVENRWPQDERLFATLLAALVHAVGAWGSCAVFVCAKRLGWWRKYQLPRDRPGMDNMLPANRTRDQEAIIEQLVGTVIALPIGIYCLFPALQWAGVSLVSSAPGPVEAIAHLVGMVLGCDTIFYWTHRAFHHPWLYPFHKKHHEYKATNAWASEYFGVVDMIGNVLPGLVPAMAMQSHFAVLLLFTLIREWQSVQSHSGFDLPWDPLNRGVFRGGARRHDFHHTHNVGCYGDWTPFWDWVCGTDRAYQKYWAERNAAY